MDLVSRTISLFLIIVLSPIFLVTSCFCLLFQGRPVLFKQERVGYNFKIFNIYKFRSMVHNSGVIITEPNDLRITKFGRFLRKTKIDEIPQLFNILKGDMRFIGPRPEVLNYFDKSSFQFLENVKPGMSDYSSILFRDEEKILERIGGNKPYLKLLPLKLELAEYYSSKKNIFLDFKLVIITIISIFFPRYSSKTLIAPSLVIDLPETEEFLKKYI
jgi:lipopolysaccharide/colanic/teichoic acid biosynthesis glycosyltransferase